ncbi:MAG: helix-turn-helix transcriptional regulator [Clostridia bacterium]|nr:helix-turn-helix transcriptional regulator [Clostridia bacterium]
MDTKKIDFTDVIITNIAAVNTIFKKAGDRHNRQDRPNPALSMKFDGASKYYCNGKEYVSDQNHFVFIGKETNYSYFCEKEGKCIMLEFNGFSDAYNGEIISVEIPNTVSQELTKLFTMLENLWLLKERNYIIKCRSIFYKILDKVMSAKSPEYTPSKYMHVIQPAIDHMNFHIDDTDISNEYLAAICGVSTVYFRKLFFKIFGISPMKHLKDLRIEKAKELLIGDVSGMAQVAEMTGFSSIYAFSKVFKAETGIPPSKYSELEFKKHKS